MLTLRVARPEDAPSLAAAEAEVARTPGFLVSRPHELTADRFERKILELEATGRYIVAVEDGRAIGHALLEPMGLEAISHVYRLTIVVHPGHQDRGVGTALMKDVMSWAAGNDRVEKVELAVRAVNARAIHLYRKLGFEQEGQLRRRIRRPEGGYIDDILMAWFPRS